MTQKRAGTSLCGWCLGPPGARRPHHFGKKKGNCPCGCSRKPFNIVVTNADISKWEGGSDEPDAA